MNDYSTLDELFDIYDEPATEGLEMMAATTVARVGGAGIAHVVHTIDADKAGQLTNDELRELKEAAKWCRSKFKSMTPDIVRDRLNKSIVKLGKNDKILKSNIAAFDYNATITDDKMRDEHWAPVVTMVSDISNTTGGFTDYGYDFYKLIKDELEKKYPNCEMSSMEVGKYIYVLKYKKSKAAKESVSSDIYITSATEAVSSTPLTDNQVREFADIIAACQDAYPSIRDGISNELVASVKSEKTKEALIKSYAFDKSFKLNESVDYDKIKHDRSYVIVEFIPKWFRGDPGDYLQKVSFELSKMCEKRDYDVNISVTRNTSVFKKGITGVVIKYTGELDDTAPDIADKYNAIHSKCSALLSRYASKIRTESNGDLFCYIHMPPQIHGEVRKSKHIFKDNSGNFNFELIEFGFSDRMNSVPYNSERASHASDIMDKYCDILEEEIQSIIDKSKINGIEINSGMADGVIHVNIEISPGTAKESAIGGDETMNDLFEGLFEMSEDAYADPAFESIATNLRRDYQEDPEEPISLKSMYCVHMNDDALKKYQEEYDQLKKVDKNAEKLRGCMYFWQKELAAFISIDIRSDKVWIDTLEVVKKFRGKKLSFQLLDVAVRKFHATDLKVHIDNKKAIGIFKTYGFKTYDKKNNWLYMTLRDDVKDIDDKHTEDVKPVDKGTKTDDIQEAKESVSEATESSLFVKSKDSTEVEKLLAHTEPTLRRQLTTVEDCDKYLEVIKNESTKFNEAANAIISAYSKYESGDKTKEDTKEFNKTVAAGKKLLNDNCRKLNVRLGKLVGDNDHISRQDVKNFAQYISGLRKIVNSIKRDLSKKKQ